MNRQILPVMALCGCLVGASSIAFAQPMGTFRWQLQPYCNVVTLNVTAQGGVFTLDGFDDQCGAGQRASVVGTAFPNPDGTIGIGLSSVLSPGGAFVHTETRISLAALSGPWRDSAGNVGTFAVTLGSATGGAPRPVAVNGIALGSITTAQLAPAAIGGAQIDPNQVQSRIAGTCPVGQYVRAVQVTGAVICEPLASGPMAYYTARHDQVALLTGGVATTILTLRGLPAGTYLFHAHATAADFTTSLSFVPCAIRAAGQSSYFAFGSTTVVGSSGNASLVAQVTMSLPVTSTDLFDAELYCLLGNSQPGAYIEEPRLYGIRLAAVDVRPHTP